MWCTHDHGVWCTHDHRKPHRPIITDVSRIHDPVSRIPCHASKSQRRFYLSQPPLCPHTRLPCCASISLALQWVEALRASIEHNFYALGKSDAEAMQSGAGNVSDGSDGEGGGGGSAAGAALAALASMAGNDICADCGASSGGTPDWVAMPYGVIVCIECSGIHRSLGVHISKVRSLSLDTWPAEMASVVGSLGNTAANQLLLAAPAEGGPPPPHASSSRGDKEAWIRHKYEHLALISRMSGKSDLPSALCAASRDDEAILPLLSLVLQARALGMLDALCGEGYAAGGEGSEGGESSDCGNEQMAASHAAAGAGAPHCLELLLQAGASLEVQSADSGRTPFHVAAANGAESCVALLLRRGGNMEATDASGATPLDLARQGEHSGCVELLSSSSSSSGGGGGGRGRSMSTDSSCPGSRSSFADVWVPDGMGHPSASARYSHVGRPSAFGGGGEGAGWPRQTRHQRTNSSGLSAADVIASLDELSVAAAPSSVDTWNTTMPTPNASRSSHTLATTPSFDETGGSLNEKRARFLRPRRLLGLMRSNRKLQGSGATPFSPRDSSPRGEHGGDGHRGEEESDIAGGSPEAPKPTPWMGTDERGHRRSASTPPLGLGDSPSRGRTISEII